VAVVGDEESVSRQIAAYADAGATDWVATPYGGPEERRRTAALLTQLAKG
jgi:alkanesulfonate monooxygenase SsuD/methylene tetrahydromethanopterin reductase-like flavin-dependent oxidoreductase (luciferase family)